MKVAARRQTAALKWFAALVAGQRRNFECADLSALWNCAICRGVGKRRHVAALKIEALAFCRKVATILAK